MNPGSEVLCPDITTMIRLDHTHVLAAFRRFKPFTPVGKKKAIVANVCLALEIHAQLEEEIFYPALRAAAGASEALDKSVPEHDEMRVLIRQVRSMDAEDSGYDEAFNTLIRAVLHHVADEETTLIPQAEDLLQGKLGTLGWEMMKRRTELLAPHAVEVATTTARTFPIGFTVTLVGMMSFGWLLLRGRRALHPSKTIAMP